MELLHRIWPPLGLVLRTPRLSLRPEGDDGLAELAALAEEGIHPAERMPFAVPWTDAPPGELAAGLLRFHWRLRAETTPEDWHLTFVVRHDGVVIGTQGLSGRDFAVTRTVRTGSWLGLRHQGRGFGTEMRAAVLAFAFDVLGAEQARSGAFTDNPASRRVSEKLGYLPDGTQRLVVRGRLVVEERQVLTAERFARHRPSWRPEVEGAGACLPFLGVGRPD